MQLRIDPNFLPAFERLGKGFRKKSTQVREALARAARKGEGLPQQDKLTLAWKQHERAVFWVRVDRAIRLMYEQDGDVQTLLFVGKHQEAEAFLRKLPRKCSSEESVSISDWLQRTAPPVAAARIDKQEKDRKPAPALSAQRQLVQALESLIEECLLNAGPAVVEEYAAPQVADLEKRLAGLREHLADAVRTDKRERERIEGRIEELLLRLARLDKSLQANRAELAALTDQTDALTSGLTDALAETRRESQAAMDEQRRVVADEMAAMRDAQRRELFAQLEQLHGVEQKISDVRQASNATRNDLESRIDGTINECRRLIEVELDRQRRDYEDRYRNVSRLFSETHERASAQDAQIGNQFLRLAELARRVHELEEKLVMGEARRGWLAAVLPRWIWR